MLIPPCGRIIPAVSRRKQLQRSFAALKMSPHPLTPSPLPWGVCVITSSFAFSTTENQSLALQKRAKNRVITQTPGERGEGKGVEVRGRFARIPKSRGSVGRNPSPGSLRSPPSPQGRGPLTTFVFSPLPGGEGGPLSRCTSSGSGPGEGSVRNKLNTRSVFRPVKATN
jgi:hypothetical protein